MSLVYVVVVRSALELEAFEDRSAIDDVLGSHTFDGHVDEVDRAVRVGGELRDVELRDEVDWRLDFLHGDFIEDLLSRGYREADGERGDVPGLVPVPADGFVPLEVPVHLDVDVDLGVFVRVALACADHHVW